MYQDQNLVNVREDTQKALINTRKDHSRLTMDREDKLKKLIVQFEEDDNTLDLHIKLTEANDTIRKLHGQIGNLEVQNADYSQIVQELSDKLKLYENKYGTVFKSKNT